MILNPSGELDVYMLNVGQGDTTIIVSPEGNVVIIDAMRPSKVRNLLGQLGNNGTIEHLVVTHPHSDHYSACNSLADNYVIREATLAPFWNAFGMGPPTYRQFIARLENQDTNLNFLSGYNRWYPDELMMTSSGGDPVLDPDKPYLELLGPTNNMVRTLEEAKVFNTNHLSIMCRLTWGNFGMIVSGDAQMENWGFFDMERLLEDKCQVLRAAHHGSKNGTQWERLDKLNPSTVIVSSDPESTHELPDLCGSAVFTEYDSIDGKFASLTCDTGSIHLNVEWNNKRSFRMMGETTTENIAFEKAVSLDEVSNPTNWLPLLQYRMNNI